MLALEFCKHRESDGENCDRQWMPTGSAAGRGIRQLIENLRQLRADAEGLGFQIRLEFDVPSRG